MSLPLSNTDSKSGLIQTCEVVLFGDDGYGQISGNSNRLLNFTHRLNLALSEVTALIDRVDGRWQFDDTNHDDLPIATTTLVNSQADYTLPASVTEIERVEIKDVSGNYSQIRPIDHTEVSGGMTEFMKTDGMPVYYDKVGSSLILYPAPATGSVTMAAGLKIYSKRTPSYFTSTENDKTPGINPLFHELIALIACANYASEKSMDLAIGLMGRVQIMKKALEEHYAGRKRDERLKIKTTVTKSQ